MLIPKPLLPLLAFWLMLSASAMAQNAASSSANPAQPAAASTPFTGQWTDRQNSAMRMKVQEDNGLYRIMAGDSSYGYQMACLVSNQQAACSGNGGLLEGQNFLYQSTFLFLPDGSLIENWRAFNNLQSVSGQTSWIRQP